MEIGSPRLDREWKTVSAMIEIYCEGNHQRDKSDNLCNSCQELSDYAFQKLDQCRFQEDKPTCSNCNIHCYRKSKRNEIKKVMRYAGPKMMFKHPILAIKHIFDGRKEVHKISQ